MSGAITYTFFAIDKPLTPAQRDQVRRLSRRVQPTARRADFHYNVEGYDIPGGYKKLLASYYDVMARDDYGQFTLAFVLPYSKDLEAALKPYACDSCEYSDVVVVEKLSDRRLLVEITAFMDWEDIEDIRGLREFPWDRPSDDDAGDDDEYDDDDAEDGYDEPGGEVLETLARLANCIREDVLKGDYRALCIAWDKLHCPDDDDDSDPSSAPPRPGNLKTLPAYLKQLRRMLHPGTNF